MSCMWSTAILLLTKRLELDVTGLKIAMPTIRMDTHLKGRMYWCISYEVVTHMLVTAWDL